MFKVGDRVENLKAGNFLKVGDKGTVLEEWGTVSKVLWDGKVWNKDNSPAYWQSNDWMKLIPKQKLFQSFFTWFTGGKVGW